MRLLNTKSLLHPEFNGDRVLLSEFYGDDIPPYAILSHRWGREEVTFDDLTKGLAPTRHGFHKLKGFCEQAAADGFEYCWIDTCCIDKSSSAELSEAINSMFAWYQNSEVCIVYLHDVDSSLDLEATAPGTVDPAPNSFRASEWFTRGWTLQELVAPLVVSFHASDWRFIGSRTSLGPILSGVTKIDSRFFETFDLSPYTIAQKMSWAAGRKTTRIEDEAYCLMGLFGINMPLLYGEGEKAFKRLQEEIIRRSTDQSVFATPTQTQFQHDSILASAPSAFAHGGNVLAREGLAYASRKLDVWGTPFQTVSDYGANITSRGIVVTLPFVEKDLSNVRYWIHSAFRDHTHPVSSKNLSLFGSQLALLNCSVGDLTLGLILKEDIQNNGVFLKYDVVLVHDSITIGAQVKTVILGTKSSAPSIARSRWVGRRLEVPPIRVEFPDPAVSGFSLSGAYDTLNWSMDFPSPTTAVLTKSRSAIGDFRPQCLLLFEPSLHVERGNQAQRAGFYLRLRTGLQSLAAKLVSHSDEESDISSRVSDSESPGEHATMTVQSEGASISVVEAIVRRGPGCWIVKLSIASGPGELWRQGL